MSVRDLPNLVGMGVGGDDPIATLEQRARLLVVTLVLAGVAWLLTGVTLLAIERGWFGDTQRPVGTVVRLVADPPGSRRLFPVVRFFNEAGRSLDVRTRQRVAGIVPGDVVDLMHEPDGDTWVRPRLLRFGGPQAAIALGAALIAGGFVLLRLLPSLPSYVIRQG